MNRIKSSDIKLGMCFSSPVFFDDGINMFLAEKKPVTQFHLSAIKDWKIPYVITYGKILKDEKNQEIDEDNKLSSLEKQTTIIEKSFHSNTLQVIAENLSQVDKATKETYLKCLDFTTCSLCNALTVMYAVFLFGASMTLNSNSEII